MISNERELEAAYVAIARVIRQRDSALKQEAWSESLRQSVADGIEAQRRKIEREIVEYHAHRLLSLTAAPETASHA